MKRQIIHIVFTLTIFTFTGYSQDNKEVDSLLNLIKKSKNDSLIMVWYNKLRRATYYTNSDDGMKYTKKFLEYAIKNKYPLEIANAQFYLGNSYVTKSEYFKALPLYLKSADYYESVNDTNRLSSAFNGIGAAYENSGNDTLSLKYFRKAHLLSRAIGDKRRDALALNNIANIYKRRKAYKMAMYYQSLALENLTPSDVPYYTLVRINYGNILMENNFNHKAKQIFETVLKEIDKEDDVLGFITVKQGLGDIAILTKDYLSAVKHLEEAFEYANSKEFLDSRNQIMQSLILAYSGAGENKKGLTLALKYDKIKDSIFSNQKDKNLSDALQKYESVKKDKTLAVQKLQIEDERKIKRWLITGAVVISVLTLIILVFYRKRVKYMSLINKQGEILQKQKIAELEQKTKVLALNGMISGQETERARIAKDLHDGLGGLLSTVKAHFSFLPIEKSNEEHKSIYDKTNELIDEACVEVRRISHNMMPHALSISGLEDAIVDLGESLNQDGIKTVMEVGKLPFKLEETKNVMIYRLVQELIVNIRKHASAENVLLQMLVHKKSITLTIEDDGKGFETKNILKMPGLGLKNIFSRVQFLDGTIDYHSEILKGSSVTIQIPIP